MSDSNDDQLRARFNSLRDHDAQSEPQFSTLLEQARSDARITARVGVPRLRWVAVAACVVLGAVLLVEKTQRPPQLTTRGDGNASHLFLAIANWRTARDTRTGASLSPSAALVRIRRRHTGNT